MTLSDPTHFVHKLVEISTAFDSVEAKRYGGIIPLWLVAGAARLNAPELIDWRGHNALKPGVIKAGIESGILKTLDPSGNLAASQIVLMVGKKESDLKPVKRGSGVMERVEKRKTG